VARKEVAGRNGLPVVGLQIRTATRLASTHASPHYNSPSGVLVVRIDKLLADRVCEWMKATFDLRKPPRIQACVLALVLQLHEKGMPFPRREEVADHLNCSKFSIDISLYKSMERNLVTPRFEMVEGFSSRGGINQVRFLDPSLELIEVLREYREDMRRAQAESGGARVSRRHMNAEVAH
jgi:hypothetical protein